MDAGDGQAERGGISRRDLLKRAGLLSAAVAVPAGTVLVRDEASAGGGAHLVEREQLEAFAAAESDTLEAILARLIPSDENGPGAAEARVGRYIDRALTGELKSLAPFYSAGLAAVDAYAQQKFGAQFTALGAVQQDAVLTDMEADTATGFAPSSSAFFEAVREHALQGMFGDPYHGGNANFVGWDLIGFTGIKLAYTAREQRLDVALEPAHKSATDYAIFGVSKRKASDHGH